MLLPPPQARHGISPDWSHDDRARQAFMRTVREGVIRKLSSGSRLVFENRVKPRFEKQNGRPFKNRQEVRTEMRKDTFYQSHLSIQRAAQELMWNSITLSLDGQAQTLADKVSAIDNPRGSLKTDPTLEIPRYISALDIHCMPGGYAGDLGDGDVTAGAIYDRGNYMYSSGRGGAYGDRSATATLNFLKREHPNFAPKRILDMGCATGNNTVPLADAYPGAEVHGIDVGAALLRYAHARAESLGKAVHFSQQNAERTNFADGSFDLVVSFIVFHETSRGALPRILAESRRLLRPGGMMVHLEVDQFADLDLWRQVVYDAETYNNNEPFWSAYRAMDLVEQATIAGWPSGSVSLHVEPFESQVTSAARPGAVGGFKLIVGRKD